jgi:hypothetical protein
VILSLATNNVRAACTPPVVACRFSAARPCTPVPQAVLIPDHHPGFITWSQYEANILESAAADGLAAGAGAIQLLGAGAHIAGAVARGPGVAGLHGAPALAALRPRMAQEPRSPFPWASHPAAQGTTTHARVGTGIEHLPRTTPPASAEPPTSEPTRVEQFRVAHADRYPQTAALRTLPPGLLRL